MANYPLRQEEIMCPLFAVSPRLGYSALIHSSQDKHMAEPKDEEALMLVRTIQFAAEKHKSQRRKGEAAEPYINHLSEVASLLATHTRGKDVNLIAAGLLHDTLEDTETTYDELVSHFGKDVADLVQEVTDDKSLPKRERRRLEVLSTPTKSERAKALKLADKISNVRSLVTSPPVGWPLDLKKSYIATAQNVAEGCAGTSPLLEKLFHETCEETLKALDSKPAGETS
jgi:hypothetical protein